jgi:hypothetical protein
LFSPYWKGFQEILNVCFVGMRPDNSLSLLNFFECHVMQSDERYQASAIIAVFTEGLILLRRWDIDSMLAFLAGGYVRNPSAYWNYKVFSTKIHHSLSFDFNVSSKVSRSLFRRSSSILLAVISVNSPASYRSNISFHLSNLVVSKIIGL